MTRYGYIGLGVMGANMVERLLGLDAQVSVFDVDPEPVKIAESQGATPAASAAAVADASDIVSICVPAAQHIDAVLNGPGGIHETARPGQTILIHSTVLPETVTAARGRVAEWGAYLHDACVAGGFFAASVGELLVLAGGLEDMDSAVVDLLNHYGNKIIDAGPVGAGAALKLGINVMTYAQFAAAGTAFELVERANGSTESLVDAWRHIGQLGTLTETFLILAAMSPEDKTDEVMDVVRSSAAIAEKDLELSATFVGTQAYNTFLDALRASMPDTFGIADETEETS